MSKEYRITELGANVLCLVGTLFLIHVGYVTWGEAPAIAAIATVTVLFPWLSAILLLLVAISPIDPRPHGTKLTAIVTGSLIMANIIVVYNTYDFEFGTDVLLFSKKAVELTVAGTNPYNASMLPADYPSKSLPTVTPLMDGGHVDFFNYPAGMILAFLPQQIAGAGKIPLHLTPLVFTAMSAFYLIAVSPDDVVLLVGIIFAGLNLFQDATAGIVDGIWLLPLLIAMHAIYADDWVAGGVWYGLAVSIKQIPWLIGPFLVIWAYQDGGFTEAGKLFGASSLVFTLLNLPFILWNPEAWIAGVLTPVYNPSGAQLIPQGVGFVSIRTQGLWLAPKTFFSLAVAVVGLGSLIAYAKLDGRWRWLAFVAPPTILFFHWRFLPSYLMWAVPVAYMALLAAENELPERDFFTTYL